MLKPKSFTEKKKLAFNDAWGGTDMQEAPGKIFPSLCAAQERGQCRNFISIPLLAQLPPHKLILVILLRPSFLSSK